MRSALARHRVLSFDCTARSLDTTEKELHAGWEIKTMNEPLTGTWGLERGYGRGREKRKKLRGDAKLKCADTSFVALRPHLKCLSGILISFTHFFFYPFPPYSPTPLPLRTHLRRKFAYTGFWLRVPSCLLTFGHIFCILFFWSFGSSPAFFTLITLS